MSAGEGGGGGLFQGFSAERFRERRDRVLEALGDGAMVLPAASLLRRAGDSELRYRPDSELFYLTGFTEPGALLLLRGFVDEARSILFVRPRDDKAERWTGARMGPDPVSERMGVDEGRSIEGLWEALPGLLSGADRVFHRLGAHPRIDALIVTALRTARARGARRGIGPRAVEDPGEILDELRLRKDSEEIEALREAASITVEGFRSALPLVTPGLGEWELEAALEAAFRRARAAAPSFATIVGSGTNACVLHYTENASRMREGELVLVDAGAERRMYAGDVTRTVPVSGAFSASQADVYRAVEEARRTAVEAAAPGVPVEEVHQSAVRTLIQGLIDLGVLAGDPEELLEAEAHTPYFPHRTCHWLGLNTHDPGDYVRQGEPRRLEPGMVLTVEPGLYFPPPERGAGPTGAFSGIGIRIEDDVLITEEGREVLTAGLPTGVEEIERLVAGEGSGDGD